MPELTLTLDDLVTALALARPARSDGAPGPGPAGGRRAAAGGGRRPAAPAATGATRHPRRPRQAPPQPRPRRRAGPARGSAPVRATASVRPGARHLRRPLWAWSVATCRFATTRERPRSPRCAPSTWSWRRGAPWPCSVLPAPASRRCCSSCAACMSPDEGTVLARRSGAQAGRPRRTRAAHTGSSFRCPRCSSSRRPAATTSPLARASSAGLPARSTTRSQRARGGGPAARRASGAVTRTRSRGASSAAWRWPGCSPCVPRCCCSTSRS